MDNKVSNENYIVIQGWMVKELQLKGSELIVFACIYGFSQTENQVFSGSLQYLADWTNCTKQGVIKALKILEDKGFIHKTELYKNNIKFCEYYSTKFNTLLNKVEYPVKQSLIEGGKQSLINNIEEDKIDDNVIINNIVDYLNQKAGTHYKSTTPKTKKFIKARLNEKFTEDDFKVVIDKKCNEWLGTDMEQYLRPETLFGTKFESYLNQKASIKTPPKQEMIRNNYQKTDILSYYTDLDKVEI